MQNMPLFTVSDASDPAIQSNIIAIVTQAIQSNIIAIVTHAIQSNIIAFSDARRDMARPGTHLAMLGWI